MFVSQAVIEKTERTIAEGGSVPEAIKRLSQSGSGNVSMALAAATLLRSLLSRDGITKSNFSLRKLH